MRSGSFRNMRDAIYESRVRFRACVFSLIALAHERSSVSRVGIRGRLSSSIVARDGADTPMPPYVGKAFTRTNFEDLSLFRYMIMVCE